MSSKQLLHAVKNSLASEEAGATVQGGMELHPERQQRAGGKGIQILDIIERTDLNEYRQLLRNFAAKGAEK